ncbi:hypothetical protein [Paenibacillus sp. sgz5001063]|uniref:hypothetical protein n=1 Tax=Paenibacillus sp. sgz5001063 TaxID=3242474 RepID=UPI0036D23F01
MKVRALLECTIDTANPAAELIATISAVLGSIPPEQHEAVLRKLDEEVGVALASLTPETGESA